MQNYFGVSIPNLDGMDSDDLRKVSEALYTVSKYAEYKAESMDLRKMGKIENAQRKERHCEDIYELLPEELKW